MKRVIIVLALFVSASIALSARLFFLINDEQIAAASVGRGHYTVKSVGEYAGIYDCNLEPLVNLSEKYEAVIIPNHDSSIRIQPYLADMDTYYDGISGRVPFICRVTSGAYSLGDGAIIFRSRVRTDSRQLAPHIIGYTSDNVGIYGIEKSCNELLRSSYSLNSATFSVDALGSALNGLDIEIEEAGSVRSGVVTTLDKNIQQICESAAEKYNIKRGAIVVMDIKSGEIRAVVSCPDFDTSDISASLSAPDAPFINRAFSAYSVGSIFKLVTSAAALEEGISPEYSYICTGSANVYGQIFNCHKWGGHGELDMGTAIVESCNTYFIALSEYIDNEKYIETASGFGFGTETELCPGMVSASGNLQTPADIAIAAERANMSFGQGMLTATPLQICTMTSAIANNGVLNEPVLIKGFLDENGDMEYSNINAGKRVISYATARKLKNFMSDTVRANNSMSKPDKTAAAGKTSTAQTGNFDDLGNEILNCWFTGYFPSYAPKYAVTVLVEGGTSGNSACGPVFREIADNITELYGSRS
ncbi:MAG: penicillin-binding protein 2 [Oscillospiraceae bacterium]|nr:penicillin-binding protein 2 [Oscillospiraceae bacterium]